MVRKEVKKEETFEDNMEEFDSDELFEGLESTSE